MSSTLQPPHMGDGALRAPWKRRTAFISGLALVALTCSGCPRDLLDEAAGSASQMLCSKVFVSHLPANEIWEEQITREPGLNLIAWTMHYRVDHERKEVRASVGKRFERRAVYREGRGCTLSYPSYPAPGEIKLDAHPAEHPEFASEQPVKPEDPALRAALDRAFAESDDCPRATKAVVVVHRGRVIAERYASGYDVTTPLLSHSVAKSLVNALIGTLVRQGRLRVEAAAPIAAFAAADDPRARVTIDNLLRMNAGFDFDEGGGPSISSSMWFGEPDTARFAERAELESEPGAEWRYSSRSYVMLSDVLKHVIGGPDELRQHAQRELFDPLGMKSVTLEFDASGTLMGAHQAFATARDWARLGLLYLNDGKVGAQRILPEGWVAYSARPTGATGYGAGFWLNHTQASIPGMNMHWGLPHAPSDAFFGRGYIGQYLVIVPSAQLVVARFGISRRSDHEADSVGRLVGDIVELLRARAGT